MDWFYIGSNLNIAICLFLLLFHEDTSVQTAWNTKRAASNSLKHVTVTIHGFLLGEGLFPSRHVSFLELGGGGMISLLFLGEGKLIFDSRGIIFRHDVLRCKGNELQLREWLPFNSLKGERRSLRSTKSKCGAQGEGPRAALAFVRAPNFPYSCSLSNFSSLFQP